MPYASNLLLASLPKEPLAALLAHLKQRDLDLGTVLAHSGAKVTNVYFPLNSVISLVVELSSGQMIETAMVGNDGVVNAAPALDGKISLNKAIVQSAGQALKIKADQFEEIANKFISLRSLLIRHEQVVFAQAQQSAACNASHTVESRMCRWLLRIHDLVDSNKMNLTQEFLAQMLGVTRPSVSIVANTLQQAGLIKYRRGNIELLDAAGLEEGACECYAQVKGIYEMMLSKRGSN